MWVQRVVKTCFASQQNHMEFCAKEMGGHLIQGIIQWLDHLAQNIPHWQLGS
jgi:hypothetical protein